MPLPVTAPRAVKSTLVAELIVPSIDTGVFAPMRKLTSPVLLLILPRWAMLLFCEVPSSMLCVALAMSVFAVKAALPCWMLPLSAISVSVPIGVAPPSK